jgi:hypothetical protein
MKNTTAGFPANVEDATLAPLTASGRVNAGIGVPRGNMREGVFAIEEGCPHSFDASISGY